MWVVLLPWLTVGGSGHGALVRRGAAPARASITRPSLLGNAKASRVCMWIVESAGAVREQWHVTPLGMQAGSKAGAVYVVASRTRTYPLADRSAALAPHGRSVRRSVSAGPPAAEAHPPGSGLCCVAYVCGLVRSCQTSGLLGVGSKRNHTIPDGSSCCFFFAAALVGEGQQQPRGFSRRLKHTNQRAREGALAEVD